MSLAAFNPRINRDRPRPALADEPIHVELPPDPPPHIPAPGPYRRPARVDVSARFIAKLREDYRKGKADEDGRKLGNLAEVRAFIDGLAPVVKDRKAKAPASKAGKAKGKARR